MAGREPDFHLADLGPPFPTSLCHRCGAPPRFVTTDRGAVFIYCPVLKCYPPQPVAECAAFVPPAAAR